MGTQYTRHEKKSEQFKVHHFKTDLLNSTSQNTAVIPKLIKTKRMKT